MSIFKYIQKREMSNKRLYLSNKAFRYLVLKELLFKYSNIRLRKAVV